MKFQIVTSGLNKKYSLYFVCFTTCATVGWKDWSHWSLLNSGSASVLTFTHLYTGF